MTRFELIRLTMRDVDDVISVRHLAVRAARLARLEAADATKVATSVSELGRLAMEHLPTEVGIMIDSFAGRPSVLVIEFVFDPDRMPAVTPTLLPSTATETVATSLNAVVRLMDQTDVGSDRIAISKLLGAAIRPEDLMGIRERLLVEPPGDLRSALAHQNEELAATLVALREREAELLRLNDELEQTNRGVVALYAQLEESGAQLRAAQRLVFEELEDALRPPAPTAPGFEMDVRYLPAQANSPTGGDLYDWILLADGTLHLTVVDVEGHGVQSTRDALLVTHAVRTLALEGHLPGQLLHRTDGLLRAAGADVRATALVARLDPASGGLTLAGAGHPQTLLVPKVGRPQYLPAPGRPIGYPEGGSLHVTTYQLDPGDTVLMYTDGLIEVRKDIIEGLATLERAASTARGLSVPQLLDTVLAACTQGDLLTDDTLLLAVRRSG